MVSAACMVLYGVSRANLSAVADLPAKQLHRVVRRERVQRSPGVEALGRLLQHAERDANRTRQLDLHR